MAQQRSWVMSAVVVGTYVCAIYGARGPTVAARTVVRPQPARPVTAVAALPAVCDVER